MKKALPVIIAAAMAAFYWWRKSSRPVLRYYKPEEFGPYWPLMNERQLLLLDEFRHRLGYPVQISPAPGAIGRPVIGSDFNPEEVEGGSWHNWFKYGQVFATDVLPKPPGGATAEERRRWVRIAREVGFTGIGVYPHWSPRPGIHLDTRTDRQPGNPAQWAGVVINDKQEYVNIAEGLV